MKISHQLEYIALSEYLPWLFHLENRVTEYIEPLAVVFGSPTACSCHCWLPGNVMKASLLCGPMVAVFYLSEMGRPEGF